MAASKTRTVVTSDDVAAFLAELDEKKQAESQALIDIMSGATGEPAKLWGSIVGFGRYHYKYDSGHEGETCLVGFSPRKAAFSLYLHGAVFRKAEAERQSLLDRLGKHTLGKGCVYVKKLADIDTAVLRQLVELSVATLRQHYPS